VVIGRRLGAAGAELAESYDDPERRGDAGPVVTLVEDTIAVIDTPDGPVVTETLTVSEVDGEEAEEILEVIEEAEAEAELEAIVEELEAEADGPGDADV
jgi:hypothetical protein